MIAKARTRIYMCMYIYVCPRSDRIRYRHNQHVYKGPHGRDKAIDTVQPFEYSLVLALSLYFPYLDFPSVLLYFALSTPFFVSAFFKCALGVLLAIGINQYTKINSPHNLSKLHIHILLRFIIRVLKSTYTSNTKVNP